MNQKGKLLKKADRNGFYENFGRKEVRELEDFCSDLKFPKIFTKGRREIQKKIDDFDKWRRNLDLNSLEKEKRKYDI